MARRSLTNDVVEALRHYLGAELEAFRRDGTIGVPLNNSGGLNISKLPEALRQKRGSDEAFARLHFYKPDAIQVINVFCSEVGIAGIKTEADVGDEASALRSAATAASARERSTARAAIEAKAEVKAVLERLDEVRKERDDLALRVASLEERLAMVRRGILVRP